MAESWKVKNRRWHANLGMMAAITLGLIAISCPFIAHKWELGGVGKMLKTIHYGEFLPNGWKWLWIDSQGFFLIFLVVSGWLMHKKAVKSASNAAADDPKAAGSSVTVVDLGNGGRGRPLVAKLQEKGLRAFFCPVAEFEALTLGQERWLVFVGGESGVSDEVKGVLVKKVRAVKVGSLKRLEFVGDGAEGEWFAEVAQGLEAGGARALRMVAGEGWDERLVKILGAKSAVGRPVVERVEVKRPERAMAGAEI